ncbi:MAG: transcriptional activator NhaR [Pseudomonadota bacterium]
MRHLNYNHLLYFWTIAQEGSIARAAEKLFLTPQTVSGQLKLLEQSVGTPLFERVGRRLVLSDNGRIVFQYADEIFRLGAELTERMKSGKPGNPLVLNVGIVSSIAKLITYQILKPAMDLAEPVQLVCAEGELEALLAELTVARLDLVISDRPIPTGLSVKAFNHQLGETGVAFFSQAEGWREYARGFPATLDGAPMLLPVGTSALRRRLEDWFEAVGVRPNVIAEFHDSALLKAFGQAGKGLFPAPSAIAKEVEAMYGAREVGIAEGARESYYAISPERKIHHPAVQRVTEVARSSVFA